MEGRGEGGGGKKEKEERERVKYCANSIPIPPTTLYLIYAYVTGSG